MTLQSVLGYQVCSALEKQSVPKRKVFFGAKCASALRSKIGLYGEKRVVAFPNFPRRFRERVGQFSHGPK